MRVIASAMAGLGLSACCSAEHMHHYPRPYVEAPRVRSYVYRPAKPRRVAARARFVGAPLVPYRPPQIAVLDGCAPAVRVVGPDAWTERGARLKAERAWSSQVRFDLGERFADLKGARDISVSCVPASGNESTVGKVGKKLVGSLAVRDRCVVEARPCRKDP